MFGQRLTPAIKLEIAEQVERRFQHLPAETLKIIQHEIEDRVAATEKHYKRLALITGTLLAILLAGFFGLTWASVGDRVTKLIADTKVQTKTKEVEAMHQQVTMHHEQIVKLAGTMQATEDKLKARLELLSKSENLVTYDANGGLMLTPSDGRLHLQPKGQPDVMMVLRIETNSGGVLLDQMFKNKIPTSTLFHGPWQEWGDEKKEK